MKQALEALEFANVNHWWGSSNIEKAIAALRLAIEQAERQEPVVMWDGKYQFEVGNLSAYKLGGHNWIPLYTDPPQQEKQEPTPAMIQALTEQYDSDRAMGIGFNPQTLCRAVLDARGRA
jgi:hypothetical protein